MFTNTKNQTIYKQIVLIEFTVENQFLISYFCIKYHATPDTQNVSLHSGLIPHLHLPNSQESDVELVQMWFTPHIHIPKVHVSDNPLQSPFPKHAKIVILPKMKGSYYGYLLFIT